MLIDIVVFALVVMAFFKGFRKGLIVALFSFLAFVIGLAAALKLSALAAQAISEHANISQRWLPVLSFVLVFGIVVLLVRLGAKVLEAGVKVAMLGWANRLGGFMMYLLIYIFILSAFLFYAVQLHLLKTATTEASVSYPFIQPIAPQIMKILSSVFPFLKNTFSELLQFFDNMSAS